MCVTVFVHLCECVYVHLFVFGPLDVCICFLRICILHKIDMYVRVCITVFCRYMCVFLFSSLVYLCVRLCVCLFMSA